MNSIYQKMHDAISHVAGACEVIVLGSNDAAASARWRFPEGPVPVQRYDAITETGSEVKRALVHLHEGIVSFHEIEVSDDPPSDWIRGISTLRPQLNAQNLRSGSREDREFISRHHRTRFIHLTPLKFLGAAEVQKFFILDLEGLDFDVCMRLLSHPEVLGIGCEHSLMLDDEIIHLRCEAVERGFSFDFSDEDAIFLRI